MSKYDPREVTVFRRNKLYQYLKQKLRKDFDVSDRFLLSTTDQMVKDILHVLNLEVEREK